MAGHSGKIFSCRPTARGEVCIWDVLEIKACFSISYNKKIAFLN